MNNLMINGKTIIPLDTIVSIVPLTDQDRARVSEKLDIDASQYQTRIEYIGKKSNLAVETLDDIRDQGVGLVNLGSNKFVPAINILAASPFTEEEAKVLQEKDYTLTKTFRCCVDTKTGRVLSQATAEQILARRAKAFDELNRTYE